MPWEPAIAVLPDRHHQRSGLQATPLEELTWPLGRPDRLYGGTVADLLPQDHLLMYPRMLTHFRRRSGISAKVSLLLMEPVQTHARHHALLRLTWRRFFRILTFNEALLAQIPNGIFFPPGSTGVPGWRDIDVTKDRMCLLPVPDNGDREGARLRRSVAGWARSEGLPVELSETGQDTAGILARCRYSVVIETVRERNYFSGPLLDAVFCSSVPIYWGCPNIGDFCNPEGMILCETETDIRAALAAMSDADHAQRLQPIRTLRLRMQSFCEPEKRAALALLSCL